MDLRSALSSLLEEDGFVSLESLTECMTEKKIRDHISSNGIPVDPEVIFTRLRLFAILILLECEKDMNSLLADVEDETFFFYNKEKIPWKPGDSDRQAKFFELQSQFPPMLTCRYPPQKFPPSFRPPFIDVARDGPAGSFGIVRRVRIAGGHLPEHSPNRYLAWKRIDHCGSEDETFEEVKTLTSRHHEHLVPLVACYFVPEGQSYLSLDPGLHLIFPWADTDMSKWMNPGTPHPPEHPAGLEEPWFRKEYLYTTIISLFSAISHLHREIDGSFTSHHDLKPQNILLFGQKWKICDFGMTRLRSLEDDSATEPNLGSFVYRPPEYEDRSVKKHGRSFDMWSLGCIIVELAVLIVYGWEEEKLRAFEVDRINNPSQPSASSKKSDPSFHNNMPVVWRWMEDLVRKDGSQNFIYLMDTVSNMLSMDRNARPYSWEVEKFLHEQFHPDEPGDERCAKVRDRVQAPKKPYTHNPSERTIAERNLGFVQCLRQNGWPLSSLSSRIRSTVDSEHTSGDAVSLLENYMPSSNQIEELFKRTYDAEGYGLDNMVNKGRRDALAEKFAEIVAPAGITLWEVKHIIWHWPPDLVTKERLSCS